MCSVPKYVVFSHLIHKKITYISVSKDNPSKSKSNLYAEAIRIFLKPIDTGFPKEAYIIISSFGVLVTYTPTSESTDLLVELTPTFHN